MQSREQTLRAAYIGGYKRTAAVESYGLELSFSKPAPALYLKLFTNLHRPSNISAQAFRVPFGYWTGAAIWNASECFQVQISKYTYPQGSECLQGHA